MRVFKWLQVVILAFLLGTTIYLGHLVYDLKTTKEEKTNEVTSLNEKIAKLDDEIASINSQIETANSENSDSIKEYNNWVRHKGKLEEVLGY